jgi:hypothetical protein
VKRAPPLSDAPVSRRAQRCVAAGVCRPGVDLCAVIQHVVEPPVGVVVEKLHRQVEVSVGVLCITRRLMIENAPDVDVGMVGGGCLAGAHVAGRAERRARAAAYCRCLSLQVGGHAKEEQQPGRSTCRLLLPPPPPLLPVIAVSTASTITRAASRAGGRRHHAPPGACGWWLTARPRCRRPSGHTVGLVSYRGIRLLPQVCSARCARAVYQGTRKRARHLG